LRDIEELLAERGIIVTYESIRKWCNHFGPEYARTLKKRNGRLGDNWYLDEVFIKIQGEFHYLWRAVDQDGDTIDILVQKRRNKQAAKRFFRKLLKGQRASSRRMMTDKLKSYSAAHREIMPLVTHSTEQYANNRAEVSHQPTRQRERQMRRFKSVGQAQRFLTVNGAV
jgi:putative transposase